MFLTPGEAHGIFDEPGPGQPSGDELARKGDPVHNRAEILRFGAKAVELPQDVLRQGHAIAAPSAI